MLNRRILRIKAMQSIYAFHKIQESNYHIAIEMMEEQFADALLMQGKEHKVQMDEDQANAIALFKEYYKNGSEQEIMEVAKTELSGKTAWDSVYFWQRQSKDELANTKKRMIAETEHLFNKYLRFVRLAGDLADYIEDVQRKKEKKDNKPAKVDFSRIFENPVLARLRSNPEVARENYKWELEHIVDWSKMLRKHEALLDVLQTAEEGLEGDKEIMHVLFRDFFFKTDAILSHFEDTDMNWTENRPVVRNMILKTIKGIETEMADIELFTLSKNWEDDKEFFEILFRETIDHSEEWEVKIAAKTKRWASDRIAALDKILMQMALTEMVSFPSIPVKVSINEYLEISKAYSTPKSWQFMNGLLDAISAEMIEAAEIRKSGRGLLDNK